MGPFDYFKYLRPQIRKISTQIILNTRRNHYNSLGVSSKATQADIKSAYYKLSMVYHPDKNKDSEGAADKFRDISEAYEVLGNVNTRKLYDRGLYVGNVRSFDETPVNKFYKSRDTRSRPPAPSGRTTIYNFDEWSRSHYEMTFAKDRNRRQREEVLKRHADTGKSDTKADRMVFLIGSIILFFSYIVFGNNNNYDQNRLRKTQSFGGGAFIPTRND